MHKQGGEAGDIAPITLAIHPFDDFPVPGRTYEKHVRKLARSFTKSTAKLPIPKQAQNARETLRVYRELAFQHGETHYQTRYNQAIDGVQMVELTSTEGPGESPAPRSRAIRETPGLPEQLCGDALGGLLAAFFGVADDGTQRERRPFTLHDLGVSADAVKPSAEQAPSGGWAPTVVLDFIPRDKKPVQVAITLTDGNLSTEEQAEDAAMWGIVQFADYLDATGQTQASPWARAQNDMMRRPGASGLVGFLIAFFSDGGPERWAIRDVRGLQPCGWPSDGQLPMYNPTVLIHFRHHNEALMYKADYAYPTSELAREAAALGIAVFAIHAERSGWVRTWSEHDDIPDGGYVIRAVG